MYTCLEKMDSADLSSTFLFPVKVAEKIHRFSSKAAWEEYARF